MSGVISKVARFGPWYSTQLKARPVATASIASGILFATGDIVNQQALERKGIRNHDWLSTARMGIYGSAIFGPLVTVWYRVLDKRIAFGNKYANLAARVGADQLLFAPFGIGLFFTTITVMEGGDPVRKLKDAYWTALKSNWMFWPAFQSINFQFVPLQHRLLTVNVVSIFWNAYLAYINATAAEKEHQEDEKGNNGKKGNGGAGAKPAAEKGEDTPRKLWLPEEAWFPSFH